jgi:hypothetical protein
LPALQSAPAQQPVQLVEEHPGPVLQIPLWHDWVAVHTAHRLPPFPQCAVSVPERQTPLSQHPLQVVGPQPQLWFSHFWLLAQATHGTPLRPQASARVPSTQISP